jgi:hypothetical protein
MFGSQCSASTSKTSIFSNEDENDCENFRLPEKYRENCCVKRKIFLDKKNYVDLFVTDKCEIIECQLGEVVNYLDIRDEIKSSNNIFYKFEYFDMLISDDNRIIYAVKFNSTLIGIERKSSHLNILMTLNNVHLVKKHFDNINNEVGFLVTFLDRNQKFTKFLDENYENFLCNRNSEIFCNIFKNVQQKREVAEAHLKKLSQEIEFLHSKQIPQVPKILLSDVSCLIKCFVS